MWDATPKNRRSYLALSGNMLHNNCVIHKTIERYLLISISALILHCIYHSTVSPLTCAGLQYVITALEWFICVTYTGCRGVGSVLASQWAGFRWPKAGAKKSLCQRIDAKIWHPSIQGESIQHNPLAIAWTITMLYNLSSPSKKKRWIIGYNLHKPGNVKTDWVFKNEYWVVGHGLRSFSGGWSCK